MNLPESLITAVANHRLVPFVGAGVSMSLKKGLFPSWPQLLERLASRLDKEGDADAASLVRIQVRKNRLDKAADEAIEGLGNSVFRDEMKASFGIQKPKNAEVDLRLPKAVWSLKPKLIVTTNYDRVLEWAGDCDPVTNSQVGNVAELFTKSTVEQPTVWHLHGHLQNLDDAILAPQEYRELYEDASDVNHPQAAAYQQIRTLFINHPLLFIGFGFQDDNVMGALKQMLTAFGKNLQPSYALLKKDSAPTSLWTEFGIKVVEFEDFGQPLLDKVNAIASAAETRRSSPVSVLGATIEVPPIPSSYIKWLADQCADITPFGMAPTDGQSVCLQQVYVPPVTTKRINREELATRGGMSVRHAKGDKVRQFEVKGFKLEEGTQDLLLNLLGEQSLYVSGDPGSGKSTFCRWISWVTSTAEIPRFAVEAPDEFKECFPESLRSRLPITVRLREFGAYLPAQPGRKTLSTAEFESCLQKWLETTRHGGLRWNDVAPHLKAGSLLLILDGVDELPLSDGDGKQAWSPRESVLAGVATAAPEWIVAGNRVLITSRPYGLDGDQVLMLDRSGLVEARIERLPDPLQDLLATRWFVALPKTSADGGKFAQDMLREVRQLSQGVEALAGNPLLLTAICIIYGEGKQLPRNIHDLYDRIVNTSLHSRYPRDPRLIEPVRGRLAAVALGMHTGDPVEPRRTVPEAEISFEELDQILAKYRGANLETESGFKDQVDTREDLLNHSGLLSQGSDRRAGFYHLSFQEFLAAEQTAKCNEGVDKLLHVFQERAEVPNWRPTLRFLMSRRATVQGHKAVLELLERILQKIDLRKLEKSAGLALSALDGLAILLDRGLNLQAPLLERSTAICLKAIEQDVTPKSRLELALMLGRIGDPRVPENFDDTNAWVTVPAGDYIYGEDNQKIKIKQPFELSKYPVTNAQFAAFVDDGYQDETFWHPAGWKWRTANSVTMPLHWDDLQWNGATCPVVGISWWEADAFCRWAGVRLPSEREWEAAARGPNGLVYPWDNKWKDGICNAKETALQQTSPVGIFPQSASSCGAHDMAGNVWEWCVDHYNPAEQKDNNAGRVLRGGSWRGRAGSCRSSIRNDLRPEGRDVAIGFRVARTL